MPLYPPVSPVVRAKVRGRATVGGNLIRGPAAPLPLVTESLFVPFGLGCILEDSARGFIEGVFVALRKSGRPVFTA